MERCIRWVGLWHTRWFQYPWTEASAEWSISVKEMVSILWGCFVWGNDWTGGVVQWNSDNLAVVKVINHGSAKDTYLAHLLRCIHFAEAKCNFTLMARHAQGVTNDKADDLSRNHLSSFLSKVPEADNRPTWIPLWLEQLGSVIGEWTNKTWGRWLSKTPTRVARPFHQMRLLLGAELLYNILCRR